VLVKELTWDITTPALALDWSTPWDGDGGVDLEPTLVLAFNQPIARTAVLAALELKGGRETVAVSESSRPRERSEPTPSPGRRRASSRSVPTRPCAQIHGTS
jgi:hypothetical protein